MPSESFVIKGETFEGKLLDGRQWGEQLSLPLDGAQRAVEVFMIREDDVQRFIRTAMGDNSGKRHLPPLRCMRLPSLQCVDVQLSPHLPEHRADKSQAFETIAAAAGATSDTMSVLTAGVPPSPVSSVMGALGAAFGAAASAAQTAANQYKVIDTDAPRGGGDYHQPSQYPSRYKWIRAEVIFGEHLGWVDRRRSSGKTVKVEATQVHAGKNYKPVIPVSFPDYMLSVSNRRVWDHDPDYFNAFQGVINEKDWKLPSGLVIPAEHAQYLTFEDEWLCRAYGPSLYHVTHHFAVQQYSWNKHPVLNGPPKDLVTTLGDLKNASGQPLFGKTDFNTLFNFTRPNGP